MASVGEWTERGLAGSGVLTGPGNRLAGLQASQGMTGEASEVCLRAHTPVCRPDGCPPKTSVSCHMALSLVVLKHGSIHPPE